ncbi:MAG: hypothetical protein JSU72_12890 [Deltaproteobacteria bacterium]|nr:MAG: hypothetical protein JSU72_12890 [Deltaproteobacteria bacterium]
MTKRLIERRKLANGLCLEFWDESRKLAGDRWFVGIRAVVPVTVPRDPPQGIPPEVIQLVLKEVGEQICFQLKEERYFISEGEVNSVREQLKEVFLKNVLSYLSHPVFPNRFLTRKLQDVADKMHGGPDYLQKVLDQLRGPGS